MKKLKITEKQANFLGLNKIKEEDKPTGSAGGGYASLGAKPIRVVIEGPSVVRLKDFILKAIKKQDETARVDFFEATSKIVGTVSENKIPAITRDLKAIDPSIIFQRKSATKALKITKEQYTRLVKAGLIKENQELMAPQGGDDLKKETMEFIKYLYRKSEELSPFWEQHGLTYDDICQKLLDKKLVVRVHGKYELSKSIGTPDKAVQALETELRTMVGEPPVSAQPATPTQPEIETEEASNLPAGTEHDSSSPWNEKTNQTTPQKAAATFKVVAMNPEIAIVKGPDNALYTFWYYDINKKALANYAKIDRVQVGNDEDGQPDYDLGDFEITPDVIENFLNDNFKSLKKGNGLADYENGADFVKIDEPLKQDLISLYDKNKNIVQALSTIQEMTSAGSSGAFTTSMGGVVKREMPVDANELEVPVVKETTAGTASVGPYDTNAFPDIDRDGTFKEGEKKLKEHTKTTAETKTQWAGGAFVKMNDCTKYNNKPAGSGCSQGAADHVVTTTKTKSNVNAPSLGKG